jgi:hypothetical protein
MSKPRLTIPCAALFLIAFFLLACGSSSSSRQLQSLSINPATADAQKFPNGQVQFTAMGAFSGSSQTSAVSALWWTTQPWTYPPAPTTISLSSSGVAQCDPMVAGTFTIYAVAPKDPSIPPSQMTMMTPQIVATAQITCP